MGMVLIYGIIILLLLALSAPIIYYILKRNGNAKLGKIIATVIIIIVLCFALTNQIDEILYFKSDVKNELKLVNVTLAEDFEIIKNEVIGFPERYQNTEINVSEKDKIQIIKEIKTSSDFVNKEEERNLYYEMLGKNSNRLISNYKIDQDYYKEYYEKKEGYVATSLTIMVKENSNVLKICRIED